MAYRRIFHPGTGRGNWKQKFVTGTVLAVLRVVLRTTVSVAQRTRNNNRVSGRTSDVRPNPSSEAVDDSRWRRGTRTTLSDYGRIRICTRGVRLLLITSETRIVSIRRGARRRCDVVPFSAAGHAIFDTFNRRYPFVISTPSCFQIRFRVLRVFETLNTANIYAIEPAGRS